MKDRLKIKHLFLGAAICLLTVGILTAALCWWRGQASIDLDNLLMSITYEQERFADESRAMLNFKELERLSDKEKAEYFMVLNKLYSNVYGISNEALEAFTSGWIYAQRSHCIEISAQLYADLAQIFLNIESWDAAVHCIEKSFHYAQKTKMSEEYYAYCYAALAFSYASMDSSNLQVIRKNYEKAESYRGLTLSTEYYSLDARLDMIKAILALKELDYDTCKEALASVKDYINSYYLELNSLPSGSWASLFILPYNRTATLLTLKAGEIDSIIGLLKESYETAEKYSNCNAVMNYFSAILPVVYTIDIEEEDYNLLLDYLKNAMVRYTKLTNIMSASTGNNMLYASESAAIRVAEEHRVTMLYKVILNILLIAVLAFLVLTGIIFLIRRRADIDGLTGAYNRRRFDKVYLSLCQKQKPFGIILYDVDYFKQFNDTYGHAFGDEVLQKVGETVNTCFRHRKAVLYRYGGDEFVVIWKGCKPEQIAQLAQTMVAAVEKVTWDNGAKVTLSVGAAHSSQVLEDPFHLADENVYRAKEAGRNCAKYGKESEGGKQL